ncbi:MAG: hypothetical protein GAK45_00270 [Pseudomonas citronellolis]|nr:MAG: hypothetical protein GAK45_00270 [Pseudomonas citronellolis]
MTALPVELVPTGPEHAELIRNLYQYYAYESSDWEDEDVEVDGRFYVHEAHFARYWDSPQWSASLILVDGFIAGFVLVEASELPGFEDALELADLFVLKKYRRQGVARTVAMQMLTGGTHSWLVRLYPQDEPAAAFWEALMADLPRTVQRVEPGDDPQLLTYQVSARPH